MCKVILTPDPLRMPGIRNFIVETILTQSSDEANLRKQKTYINKLDMTLIQVSSVATFASVRLAF